MSVNSFGRLLRFTTWGESHGPALGAVVDGCPPGLPLCEADIQPFLNARRPGQSKFTTQRQEPDEVRILSGVFEGRTTGTPVSLMSSMDLGADMPELPRHTAPATPTMPMTRSTASATIAAAGAALPAKRQREWRRARLPGSSSPKSPSAPM